MIEHILSHLEQFFWLKGVVHKTIRAGCFGLNDVF
jgi:hypothetical protein